MAGRTDLLAICLMPSALLTEFPAQQVAAAQFAHVVPELLVGEGFAGLDDGVDSLAEVLVGQAGSAAARSLKIWNPPTPPEPPSSPPLPRMTPAT
jgi:uncharacterized membrane protein YgcG